MFETSFIVGNTYSNAQIHEEFRCGNMGGIRPSNERNAIVLISNKNYGLYRNYWENNILYFYGGGINRDQQITRYNRSLYESTGKNQRLYLFEKWIPSVHHYVGEVKLISEPIIETIIGNDSREYTAYKFPLQLITNSPYIVSDDILEQFDSAQQKAINNLSDDVIKQRAEQAKNINTTRTTLSKVFSRSPWIAENAKRRAAGICELCKTRAPFLNLLKQPYLETHHIIWLSEKGKDTIENTVALCPNCHRKMHIVNNSKDVEFLKAIPK